jgi:hypothetical protein
MLSCAPYSSSGGGRVGNPFFCCFPYPFPSPLPLLAYFVPMLPDTHGERAVPRCYSGLYPMYAHMMKQRRKVFGGRKLGVKPKTI